MKKRLLIAVLFVMTLVFTGCSSDKEETKTLSCYRDATVSEGVKMEVDYNVTYKGDYVEKIETVEKIISDDTTVLEYYKNTLETMYSAYSGIDHYNNTLSIDGNTFTSKTEIDYSKIDTDKLISVDSANSTIIKDGKVLVSDIKLMYESVGAICE